MTSWRNLIRRRIPGATDAEADYARIHLAKGLFKSEEAVDAILAAWCQDRRDPLGDLRRMRAREWEAVK